MASRGTPSDWLLGTWRSSHALPPPEWAFLDRGRGVRGGRRDLDRISMVFTPRRVYFSVGARSMAGSYRVLWQRSDALFLTFGPRSNETGLHIQFLSPEMFWVHSGRQAEYFEKLDST